MSEIFHEEHDMQFDNLHTLENFLDIYNDSGEMVVTEAIANSLDVNATKIDIELKNNSDGKHIISFQDNGPGMDDDTFADYHVGSRSTKSKGNGIGFAGIGAKIYLAAWSKTQIITETCSGKNVLASMMYRDGRKIKWKQIQPSHKEKGTLYQVILNDIDYYYLLGNIEEVIINFFNNALLSGLKITINGKTLHPWKPKNFKRKEGIVSVKTRKLPYVFILTEKDIPEQRIGMEFHVKGKKITIRNPDFILDLKPEFQKRLHIIVDSVSISDQLKTDKVAFKPGIVTREIYRELDREMLKITEKLGLLDKQAPQAYETNKFTKALADLFNEPDLAWLNPDALGTKSISQRNQQHKSQSQNSKKTDTSNRKNDDTNKPNNKKGFSIMYVFMPGKPDGWLDLESNRPVLNLEHPLYKKYEKHIIARNYHVAKTVITILVKYGAAKKSLSVDEAFDLQTEILSKLRDTLW